MTTALLIGLPIVLLVILRANAAVAFLALCAGSVLAQFVSGDTKSIFSSFVPANSTTNLSIVQLGLLFGPVLLSAIFTRKSVSGAKMLLNLIAAMALGIVGALLAVPLLPGGVTHSITSQNLWSYVHQYQSVVVAVGVLISLFSLWFNKSKQDKDKKKHK